MTSPHVLKNVTNPICKKTTVDFDEELLVIKQQFPDEDNERKSESFEHAAEKNVKTNVNVDK